MTSHRTNGNAPAGQAGALTKNWGTTNDCNLTAGTCPHAEQLGAVSHMHALAIVWARHGIAVGALNGKAPVKVRGVLDRGVKDFTVDESKLCAMWERYPSANIGGRPPRGVVVLDVDPRNGGAETWEQINTPAPEGWLPTTLMTRTGSGGTHEWYRLPVDLPVRGEAGDGIDVKTSGGYLVMPGSTHPDTGEKYHCEQWAWPPHFLPEWWRPHVYCPHIPARPRTYMCTNTQSAGAGLVRTVLAAGEGQRNKTLHWAACRAATDGLGIEQELQAAGESIGLPALEVTRTIASARNTVKAGV